MKKWKCSVKVVTVVCVLTAATATLAGPVEFYVGEGGSDQNPGTSSAPFATLERARDAIRAASADQPRRVLVRGSIHRVATFTLGKEDSGTEENPIVWEELPGVGEVPGTAKLLQPATRPRAGIEIETRLTGGVVITTDAWRPVTDEKTLARIKPEARAHVREIDLQLFGIRGVAPPPDFFQGAPPLPELFVDDQRMQLARWPNEGWATIAKVIDPGTDRRSNEKAPRPSVFEYPPAPEGSGLERWDISAGVWLLGYWRFDWREEAVRIKTLDPATRRITLAAPLSYPIHPAHPSTRRFRAFNLLEELDSPGEYCIDPKSGRLYFWPGTDPQKSRVVVGALPGPVVQINDAQHVVLRGFVVEATMGNAIEVRGGRNVRIQACHVRNVRQTGIVVSGGQKHRVEACDVHDTGAGGVTLEGGDRKTLTPAGHQASNNHIWRYAIHKLTYASAIELKGVGNLADHNLIHDAPHMAVSILGNDHVFEFNVVHDVCNQSDDAGALYKGRNPSCRGNVIRHNLWHHIGDIQGPGGLQGPRSQGTAAIYFDDGDGGDSVIGNIFYRCGEPNGTSFGTIFSHGGHDLLAENNIFIACKRALGSTPWNDAKWKTAVDGGMNFFWTTRLFEEVDITKPPYTTRYPALVGFMDPKPGQLRVNRAERNVFVDCASVNSGNWQCDKKLNLTVKGDPGFENAAKGDFRLKADSLIFRSLPDFKLIPFEKIGLFADPLRPALPVERWEEMPVGR